MSRSAVEIQAARADTVSELMLEIERYLAAIALFRRLGCQPNWRNE